MHFKEDANVGLWTKNTDQYVAYTCMFVSVHEHKHYAIRKQPQATATNLNATSVTAMIVKNDRFGKAALSLRYMEMFWRLNMIEMPPRPDGKASSDVVLINCKLASIFFWCENAQF